VLAGKRLQQIALLRRVKAALQHHAPGLAQFGDPLRVAGAELPFKLLPYPLCQDWDLSGGRNGDLQIAAPDEAG